MNEQLNEQLATELLERMVRAMQPIEFPPCPVPTDVAAKVLDMTKDVMFYRMETGELDIGNTFPSKPKRKGGRPRRDPYISPKKFYEFTGYLWKGKKEDG